MPNVILSDCESMSLPRYPSGEVEGRLRLKFADLSENYASEEKCAAWLFPEMTLDFSPLFDDKMPNYYEPKIVEENPTDQYRNLLIGKFLCILRRHL